MLNKHNLSVVAQFASKEESRYAMQAILVEPGATIATDGHVLGWVSVPEKPESSSFPVVAGAPQAQDVWEPFLLDADAAQKIAKAIPKSRSLPTLEHVAIGVESNGDGNKHEVLTVTDLENPQVFRPRKPEGKFPSYQAVMPKPEEAKFTIHVDANLLLRAMRAFAEFHKGNRVADVKVSFYEPTSSLRMDSCNSNTDQGMTVVLMPLRGDTDPHNVYGWKEKHAKELAEEQAAKEAQGIAESNAAADESQES